MDALLVRTMPPGSLEQMVFRMDLLGRLEAAGVPVFNPPRAIEAAVDKYLASARLAAAGLPVPRTIVCQTPDDAMAAFAALGGDVVVKPLFGSEGRGIARLQDEALAAASVSNAGRIGGGAVCASNSFRTTASTFACWSSARRCLPCGGGIRRIGEQTSAAAQRPSRSSSRPKWRSWPAAPPTRSAAPLAGVDLLPGRDGRLYVLEVNAVPGWKALAAALHVDIAAAVLEFVKRTVAR